MNRLISQLLVLLTSIINKTLLSPLRARKDFQPLFQKLHAIGLHGMNYGRVDMNVNGELWVIHNILKNIPENAFLFDIGANEGNYSQSLLNASASKTIHIYAFEPIEKVYKVLETKFKTNTKVNTFNIGFSDVFKKSKIYYGNISEVASVYQTNKYEQMQSFEEIQLDTIDNFCHHHNISMIHFMKIDVEGHEMAVLHGAKQMIENGQIKYIQFEFGHNVYSKTFFKDFYDYLSTNYYIHRILKDGLQPITSYNSQLHEIFEVINFLAVHKNEHTK